MSDEEIDIRKALHSDHEKEESDRPQSAPMKYITTASMVIKSPNLKTKKSQRHPAQNKLNLLNNIENNIDQNNRSKISNNSAPPAVSPLILSEGNMKDRKDSLKSTVSDTKVDYSNATLNEPNHKKESFKENIESPRASKSSRTMTPVVEDFFKNLIQGCSPRKPSSVSVQSRFSNGSNHSTPIKSTPSPRSNCSTPRNENMLTATRSKFLLFGKNYYS